jgi:endonuclease/exonuclease/phosphatase family metal-dependent hydrolase
MERWWKLFVISVSSSVLVSCLGAAEDDPGEGAGEVENSLSVPAKGAPSTLDIGSWNLEWFGDTINGPSNEGLQLTNARDIINGMDLDILGVEEIVSVSQFNQLKSQLAGYAGFLANDATVTSGSTYYSSAEQKVGLLYKSSVATVQSAKIILTGYDYQFAGRPPLEVAMNVTVNGTSSNIIVIVLHAKALGDGASYSRRQNASNALKSYLDSTYPTQKVFVIGDFNDDVDTSITSGMQSPYKNFVDDVADYSFPTRALTLAGDHSTATHSNMLDHHLFTNDVQPLYLPGSAEVYYMEPYVPSYSTTTSDHYPVITRYALGGPSVVFINEILANEPGADTTREFVEIVNTGGTAANLGGYTISDATGLRHTFAAGTSLNPGSAILVYGGAAGIPAGLPNAVAASTGGLSLNNSTESVILKNGATVISSVSYGSPLASTDGVSMNRSPEGSSGGTFVLHTSLSASVASPGKKANGTSWGP